MRTQNILITFVFVVFATLANADMPGPPAGNISASNGQAGIVAPGDGMQPDANPLAPDLPLTPPGTYPAVTPSNSNTLQQPAAAETAQPTTQYTPEPYIPGPAANPADNPMMEQCKVVDRDGNGLIKAYMADSGPNLEGDASAWIWVPRGQCTNINMGNFSGVSAQIRAKINPSDLTNAQTIE